MFVLFLLLKPDLHMSIFLFYFLPTDSFCNVTFPRVDNDKSIFLLFQQFLLPVYEMFIFVKKN